MINLTNAEGEKMSTTVQDVIGMAIGHALISGADIKKTAAEAATAFAAAEAAYGNEFTRLASEARSSNLKVAETDRQHPQQP